MNKEKERWIAMMKRSIQRDIPAKTPKICPRCGSYVSKTDALFTSLYMRNERCPCPRR